MWTGLSRKKVTAMAVLQLILLFCTMTTSCALSIKSSTSSQTTRRNWLTKCITVSSVILETNRPTSASAQVEALPNELRQYTALAPLGAATSTGQKLTNLSLQQIAEKLAHDLGFGANGNGGYFISGDLTPQIFRDDCTFIDPTNSVSSLSRYENALKILFEPKSSYVHLLDMSINEETNEIYAKIESGGMLQLPWKPRISTYQSDIVYKIDQEGLIMSQSQVWSIPASQALRETFTPSFLNAPYSNMAKPDDEPEEVTRLFELVNGRDVDSYSQEMRFEIADLITEIVDKQYPWNRNDLEGKWALVHLQPGPNGGGIDRRIPFPELPFNHNFQIFTTDSVTNVGELLGPLLEVRVGGSLVEEDENRLSTPKRFKANIENGGLCAGNFDKCIPLPIRGEGLFDGVYLGKRLRIGQNLNGGGARVVQVKLE